MSGERRVIERLCSEVQALRARVQELRVLALGEPYAGKEDIEEVRVKLIADAPKYGVMYDGIPLRYFSRLELEALIRLLERDYRRKR